MISTEVTHQNSEGELFQDVRWHCPTYLMVSSGISVITWSSDHITLGCQLISGITYTGSLWMRRHPRHCECTVRTKGISLMHYWKIYWCTFKYYLSLWVVSCTEEVGLECVRDSLLTAFQHHYYLTHTVADMLAIFLLILETDFHWTDDKYIFR